MSDLNDLLSSLRTNINKDIGKEVAFSPTKETDLLQVKDWIQMPEFFSTGVGGEGIPCGHITQIVGDSDTGKTTLAMTAMVQCQAQGGIVFLIDSEHKFSFSRFELMGGVSEEVIVLPTDSLEEAWDAWDITCKRINEIRKKNPNIKILIMWDSVPASVANRILTSDADQAHVAVEAKINNVEVRKIRQHIKKNNIAAIFINHTYWTMPTFGISKEVVKGGEEMYLMSTLVVKTKRKTDLSRQIKGMKQVFGLHSILEVKKGHFHGRKTQTDMYIVDKGVLSKEELEEYKAGLKGKL